MGNDYLRRIYSKKEIPKKLSKLINFYKSSYKEIYPNLCIIKQSQIILKRNHKQDKFFIKKQLNDDKCFGREKFLFEEKILPSDINYQSEEINSLLLSKFSEIEDISNFLSSLNKKKESIQSINHNIYNPEFSLKFAKKEKISKINKKDELEENNKKLIVNSKINNPEFNGNINFIKKIQNLNLEKEKNLKSNILDYFKKNEKKRKEFKEEMAKIAIKINTKKKIEKKVRSQDFFKLKNNEEKEKKKISNSKIISNKDIKRKKIIENTQRGYLHSMNISKSPSCKNKIASSRYSETSKKKKRMTPKKSYIF